MRILSTLVMLCAALVGFSQTVDITFELNMSSVTTDPSGVFIAGGGNFGDPGDNPLTQIPGTDIWTITFTQDAGFSSFYTFTNGNCPDYSCKENLAGLPCGDPANFNDRFLPPVNEDVTIQACFGQCNDDGTCDELIPRNVTFKVNMRDYSGTFSTVSVGGTWNGFNPTDHPMTPIVAGSDIYEVTIPLFDGIYEYKFIEDGGAGPDQYYENLIEGTPCTVTNFGFTNRGLTVDGDVSLDNVCFESCNDCGVATCDDGIQNGDEQGVDCGGVSCPECAPSVDITFIVNMSNETVSPTGVFLAGGGNFGNPGDNPLTDIGDGLWSITVTKDQGFSGAYTFTNGNCPDYSCKENIVGQPCAFGEFNDRFTVPVNQDTTILHCFSQCTTDGSCTEPPVVRDVTFSVDMNQYAGPEIIDANSIYVFGTFNGFNPSANQMVESDVPGVYETTIPILEGNYEFLYTLNEGAATEDFGDATDCTTGPPFNNRTLVVDADLVLPTVCYESCVACDAVGPDCSAFDTAPVELTKSFDPVNGVRDRVQVKWFKAANQTRYTVEDNAACDIEYWAYRFRDDEFSPWVNIPPAERDTSRLPYTTVKKNNNRELFKWPLKFRLNNGTNQVLPNRGYRWRVRCYCDQGDLVNGQQVITPWSEEKFFNTPDFDPETGIYDPPGGIVLPASESKLLEQEMAVSVYPNPSNGQELNIELDADLEGLIELRVIDLSGAIVHRHAGSVKGSRMLLNFDNALTSGMYFIQLEMNGTQVNKRFVVR